MQSVAAGAPSAALLLGLRAQLCKVTAETGATIAERHLQLLQDPQGKSFITTQQLLVSLQRNMKCLLICTSAQDPAGAVQKLARMTGALLRAWQPHWL